MKRACFFIFFLLVVSFSFQSYPQQPLVLTPAKVKELLLEQGLGVQMTQASFFAAEQKILEEKGRFDTQLTLGGDHTYDQSARTSTFFGSRTDTSRWNAGLERLFATGTRLGFAFENEREKTFGANPAIGIPDAPLYEPSLHFKFNQSLGKNFVGTLDRAELRQVKKAVASLDHQSQQAIIRQLVEAQTIFYQWAESVGALQNGREALQAAREFLRVTVEKEKLGLVEKSDRLGGESLVAKRNSQIANLESIAKDWEVKLKMVLLIPLESSLQAGEWEVSLPQIAKQDWLASALEHRHDLQAAKETLREKEIQLAVAKQKRLPTIDLFSSYRLNAIEADDYEGALSGIDSPKWMVGVGAKFPIENRLGRGLKRQADFEKKRSLLALKQLEQNILLEVEQRYSALALAQSAWEERKTVERLEKQKLDYALEQYRMGRFQADLVLRYQDDLLNARQEAVAAKRHYALAILALKEAANKDL